MAKFVMFHGEACEIKFGYYGNGRVAISLVDMEGMPYATATVNLPDEDCPEGCAFIKDYSENTGMTKTLADAGIIEPKPLLRVQSGFVLIGLHEVLTDA